jgi:hypothetical protein
MPPDSTGGLDLRQGAAPPPGILLGSQLHLLYDDGMLAASLDQNKTIASASGAAAAAPVDVALASAARSAK